ncbi:MAG TPA: pyridoxamine 5'-phosphate oxidase family protein [Acidimicrobiia bacterium]|jgi:PPOX class probable F420-dependent enzyme
MSFIEAHFLDVADGVQPGQFTVGSYTERSSLADLPDIYRQLLDQPVTAVLAVIGGDGRPNLTPVWIGHDGDKIIFNFAEHRRKTEWIRNTPQLSVLLLNPANPYHWMSLKVTVVNEIHEDDTDGHRATDTIDRAWTKYVGAEPPYGLRDPAMDERRVLFECAVDRVATFGRP